MYVITINNGEVTVIHANSMIRAVEIYSEHYPMEPFSIRAAREII